MSESERQGYNNNPTDTGVTTHLTDPLATWIGLTAFRRDILAIIADHDGAPYGLAIKRGLEELYGVEINHGRLYPNLDELVGRGLVHKSERDKRTNEYALTGKGIKTVSAGADRLDEVRPTQRYTTEPSGVEVTD